MAKYKILLGCVSGMSTSLLVRNMRKAAATRDVLIEIYYTSELDIVEKAKNMDIVLLGPQLRTSRRKFATRLASSHIPVFAIPIVYYGDIDGEQVLAFAIEKIEEERKSKA